MALAVLTLSAISTATSAPPPPPPPPPCRLTSGGCVIFHGGDRDDNNRSYACFRIPGLVRLANGSLLAFAEGRVGGCRPDVAPGNPLVARASADNGATWGPIRVVASPASPHIGLNYPAGLALPAGSGGAASLLLFFVSSDGASWLQRSDDGGSAWSAPSNMSGVFRGRGGCGTPAGAVLPSGRLAIACSSAAGIFALLSDDGGASWRVGAPVPMGTLSGGEQQLAPDGRAPASLSMVLRVRSNSSLANHAVSRSDDGGESWSPAELLRSVSGTTCSGSIGRDAGAPPGVVLLTAPHLLDPADPGGRYNLTLWVYNTSAAPGAEAVAAQQLWSRAAGYSALEAGFGGSAGASAVLFEAGDHVYDTEIVFANRL